MRLYWCWRRLLRVPWTARRSNQSILKEISPEYSLELLKLKLQYFGHLMWKANSFEKTLMLGKIEGGRRREQQRMISLDGITEWMDMSLSKLGVGDGQGGLACCSPWDCKESDLTERLNWTESFFLSFFLSFLVESMLREELPNHLVCFIFSGSFESSPLLHFQVFLSACVNSSLPTNLSFSWIQLYSICFKFFCTTAKSFSSFYFF